MAHVLNRLSRRCRDRPRDDRYRQPGIHTMTANSRMPTLEVYTPHP
jgi:hypothetical protein